MYEQCNTETCNLVYELTHIYLKQNVRPKIWLTQLEMST